MRKLVLFLVLAVTASGCRGNQGWSEIFIKKGESYFKKGKYDLALDEFTKAKHFDPSGERIYENMARTYLKMNNQSVAVEAVNKLIQLHPDAGAEIYFLRGEAVAMNPVRRPEAITAGYNHAIEKDPSQGKYYFRRGMTYQKLGRTDMVEKDLAEARRLGYKELKKLPRFFCSYFWSHPRSCWPRD